jgi:anti-sigma regulatory factor (Ser/Thr protein kinase)
LTDLFDQYFAADLSRMAEMRRLLRESLEGEGVEESRLDRLVLVVDEVVSNSIEHGADYRQSSKPIRVQVQSIQGELFLKIDDIDMPADKIAGLAQVFGEESEAAPSAMALRGRGMYLITSYLEDLEIVAVDGAGMRLQGRLHVSGG